MTKTIITPCDVAEHLRTAAEMAACPEACMEEAPSGAAFIAKALGDIARAKGMSEVAALPACHGKAAARSCRAIAIRRWTRSSRFLMRLACGSGQKPFRDHEDSPRHIPRAGPRPFRLGPHLACGRGTRWFASRHPNRLKTAGTSNVQALKRAITSS